MFHEFAVEPSCFVSPEIRHLARECGFDEGRLIREFPKAWVKRIYDFLDQAGFADEAPERIRATEAIKKLRDVGALFHRPDAAFCSDLAWLENAIVENARSPLRAIVVTKETVDDAVCIDDLWEGDSPWKIDRQRIFSRNPSEIASVSGSLIRYSTTVKFCDPYFSSTKRNSIDAISQALKAGSSDRRAKRPLKVELHFQVSEHEKPEVAIGNAKLKLDGSLLKGTDLKLVAWGKVIGKFQFHNRYLLTDVGGLKFGASFDGDEQPDAGSDEVERLQLDVRLDRWELFDTDRFSPLAVKNWVVGQ